MPFTLVLALVLAPIALIASFPMTYFARRKQDRAEKLLRLEMESKGRTIPWDQIHSKLRAGEGTLILETYQPKGPGRWWWTNDDLLGSAPVPLQSIKLQVEEPDNERFAAACWAKYLDPASGLAMLTKTPEGLFRERRFTKEYPKAKVLHVQHYFDKLLAIGLPDFPEPRDGKNS